MKVAIQGIAGSFHDQAAKQYFNSDIELVECENFREVFNSVQDGEAEYGVIAVENSLHGSINPVYRLLAERKLNICGEVRLQIEMYLIGNNQNTLNLRELDKPETEILSQREALSQCELWLNDNLPNARITETHDTAQAARYAVHSQADNIVAVAGKSAAELYDGHILAGPINDEPENYTRFFVITKEAKVSQDADRTSLILTEKQDKAGTLFQALKVFADLEINLSKIDSHTLPGKKRRYAFYIDFDKSATSTKGKQALKQLSKLNWNIQILGSYKSD